MLDEVPLQKQLMVLLTSLQVAHVSGHAVYGCQGVRLDYWLLVSPGGAIVWVHVVVLREELREKLWHLRDVAEAIELLVN